MHAYVRVAPEIESLTISARLKATNLKVGTEGWHDARVAMSFEGTSSGYPAQVPELAADSDWVTKAVELKVPKGATRLNIQPAMFHCTGVFELADLTVTAHLVAAIVNSNQLILDWGGDASGTGSVTVRATDAAGDSAVAGEAAVSAGDAVASDFLCVRCFFAGEGDSAGAGD